MQPREKVEANSITKQQRRYCRHCSNITVERSETVVLKLMCSSIATKPFLRKGTRKELLSFCCRLAPSRVVSCLTIVFINVFRSLSARRGDGICITSLLELAVVVESCTTVQQRTGNLERFSHDYVDRKLTANSAAANMYYCILLFVTSVGLAEIFFRSVKLKKQTKKQTRNRKKYLSTKLRINKASIKNLKNKSVLNSHVHISRKSSTTIIQEPLSGRSRKIKAKCDLREGKVICSSS